MLAYKQASCCGETCEFMIYYDRTQDTCCTVAVVFHSANAHACHQRKFVCFQNLLMSEEKINAFWVLVVIGLCYTTDAIANRCPHCDYNLSQRLCETEKIGW